MKKANKILMAAVAILLSLVLISTSVLSGVFAKFVITDKADISVGFTKWGVTVTLTPNTAQLNTVKTNGSSDATWGTTTDGVTFEIKNLKLAPGDNLDKIAHFTISGSAEVPLRVNIIVHIDFLESDFKITTISGNSNLDTEAKLKQVYPNINNAINNCYFPIRFGMYLKKADNSEEYVAISNPFRTNIKTGDRNPNVNDGYAESASAEYTCAKIFVQKLDVVKDAESEDACVYKDFLTPGTSISFIRDDSSVSIKDFYLGFDYPFTYSNNSLPANLTNAVSTYLSQNKPNSTFDVRFTVSVEQIVT